MVRRLLLEILRIDLEGLIALRPNMSAIKRVRQFVLPATLHINSSTNLQFNRVSTARALTFSNYEADALMHHNCSEV